jgi:O-antigen ligase
MQKTPPIISVAAGLFLVALPLLYSNADGIFANEVASCATLLFAAVGAGLLLCRSLVRSSATPRCAHATVTDVALGLFLLWGIVSICTVSECEVDTLLWYRWGAVACFYVLVRTAAQKQVLLYALFLSGVTQSLIAAGQQLGIASSNHAMFAVTGSLGNPGQLGGYLAVCLVAGIGLLSGAVRRKARIGVCLLAVGNAVQCYGLYLSDSRAGFVGAALGLAAWFTPDIITLFKRRKVIFVTTAALLVAVTATLLYSYRPASANARLLIWRVSADMVADRPLLGHGVGAFTQKYMLYQAAYFEENPASPFALVADNTACPFNELLSITIALGAVGLLAFLLAFFVALASRSADPIARIFKAALVALVVFSLFSYPSEVFPLLLLYAVCFGGVGSRPAALRCRMPQWAFAAGVLLSAAAAWQSVQAGKYIRHLSDALSALHHDATDKSSIDIVERSYGKMKHNVSFHDYYMTWLNSRPDLLAGSEKIKSIQPSCEGYCLLGKYYSVNNDSKLAEQTFLAASNMSPTRIRPKLYLWELYVAQGDTTAAIGMAQKILRSPVKVESIYTLRVKEQMKQFLDLDGLSR